MSNNNGTGFWVVAALIAALSIAALVEAATRFVVRACTKRRVLETARVNEHIAFVVTLVPLGAQSH